MATTRTGVRRWGGVALAGAMLAGTTWLAGSRAAMAADHEASATSTTHESAFDDAVMQVKVRTELLAKLGWDGLRIDVDVHGPDVVLSGTVNKRPTQELAKEVTLAVPGVKDVTDNVRVVPESSGETPLARDVDHADHEVRDALLELHVKGRLLEEIGREAMHVKVEASNGVVSLRGRVPTDDQREIAVRTAEHTKGVTKVVDLIREAS
jgi:hyperosmotically inducible periplasmic protein